VGARGCSRDWRELAEALGGEAVRGADLELLCFLENRASDTQLKVWRDRTGAGGRKRLLVAFRGTEFWKVRDLITDLKLLQDPWAVHELDKREGGKEGGKTEVPAFLATAQASPQESREPEGSREAHWLEERPPAETGEGRSDTGTAASPSPIRTSACAGVRPCSSTSLARVACGNSGRPRLTASTQSMSSTKGGRSGSGKKR
jgi:hypothetical protein